MHALSAIISEEKISLKPWATVELSKALKIKKKRNGEGNIYIKSIKRGKITITTEQESKANIYWGKWVGKLYLLLAALWVPPPWEGRRRLLSFCTGWFTHAKLLDAL